MLAAGGILMGSGCRIAKDAALLPVEMVATVVPGAKTQPTLTDPAALQAQIQRFADDFLGQ